MDSWTVVVRCGRMSALACLALSAGMSSPSAEELLVLRPAKANYAEICTAKQPILPPAGVEWSEWRPGSRQASPDEALAFAREALSTNAPDDQRGIALKVLERLVERAPSVRPEALYELAAAELFGPKSAASGTPPVHRLRQSLALGYGRAAVLLGQVYEEGLSNIGRDLKQAELYFKLAVQNRLEEGALKLAGLAAKNPGMGSPAPWVALAQQMMSTRLAAGDCSQLMAMARIYLEGKIVPRAPEVGAEWLESAWRSGDPRAARLLGELLLAGDGLARDIDRGLAMLQGAADAGDVGATLALGRWYRGDYGAEPEPHRARGLFEAAAGVTPPEATALIEFGRVVRDGVGAEPDWDQAEALFRRAAGLGSSAGMRELGAMLLERNPSRTEEGLSLLRSAAGRGDIAAAATLGRWLLTRSFDPATVAEGIGWLDDAALQGHITSAKVLGRHFENRREPERAARYWGIGAQQNDPEAIIQLAALQYRGLINPTDESVESLFQRAIEASRSRPWGYVAVGRALRDGLLGVRDPEAAFAIFRQGAEAGEVTAVRETGLALVLGAGTPVDSEEGKLLLQKASQLGDEGAGILLARGSLLGWFGKADPQAARILLEDAASAGSVSALYELGGLYSRGAFGELNPESALDWWRKAAERGDVGAMRDLANAYAIGFGVEPDPRQSLIWLERAARRGDEDAIGRLAYVYHAGIGTEPDSEKAAYWSRMARAAAPLPALGEGVVQ